MKQVQINGLGQIFQGISKQARIVCLLIVLCPTVSYATSTGMLSITGGIEAGNVSPVSLTDNFDQVFYANNADPQPSIFYQRLINDSYFSLNDSSGAASATDNMIAMNTSLTASDMNLIASSQIPQFNTQSNNSIKQNPGLATLSVPASMWLFGAALIGFVTISRRVSF
jgi:hypothetical protein